LGRAGIIKACEKLSARIAQAKRNFLVSERTKGIARAMHEKEGNVSECCLSALFGIFPPHFGVLSDADSFVLIAPNYCLPQHVRQYVANSLHMMLALRSKTSREYAN